MMLLANCACPIDAESFCAGELFVWTDGTPTDYEAWEGLGPANFQGFMGGRGCDPGDMDTRMDCVEAWEQGTSWSTKYPCSLVVAVLPKSNRHEIQPDLTKSHYALTKSQYAWRVIRRGCTLQFHRAKGLCVQLRVCGQRSRCGARTALHIDGRVAATHGRTDRHMLPRRLL